MTIVVPTPADLLPTPPTTADPASFDARMDATLLAQQAMVPQVNQLAQDTYTNAQDASASATAASGSASAAATSESSALSSKNTAQAAETAAVQAFDDFDKRYLGAKASAPTLDNDGNPLQSGALFFLIGTGMRVWSGSAWEAAYLPASGYQEKLVSGTNIKTVSGQSLLGAGSVNLGPRNYVVAQYTASATFVVPADTFVIRPYAFGAGAAGTGSASGGGGGCAYGDIAVTPGQSVTLSIAAGVAKVTVSGVDLLIANPASGVTAGTASKHASVANGGAYPGGAGVSAVGRGGSSSGSPLGPGYSSSAGGGSGWGGEGNSAGGGGVGGPSVSIIRHSRGGPSLPFPSIDPLLAGLTGAYGPLMSAATAQNGEAGAPGCGGGVANTSGVGGWGGFGGGGGPSSTIGPGGFGGFGGGAGGGTSSGGSIGGDGGFGGGGGAGNGAAGGTGGPAVIRIYY